MITDALPAGFSDRMRRRAGRLHRQFSRARQIEWRRGHSQRK